MKFQALALQPPPEFYESKAARAGMFSLMEILCGDNPEPGSSLSLRNLKMFLDDVFLPVDRRFLKAVQQSDNPALTRKWVRPAPHGVYEGYYYSGALFPKWIDSRGSEWNFRIRASANELNMVQGPHSIVWLNANCAFPITDNVVRTVRVAFVLEADRFDITPLQDAGPQACPLRRQTERRAQRLERMHKQLKEMYQMLELLQTGKAIRPDEFESSSALQRLRESTPRELVDAMRVHQARINRYQAETPEVLETITNAVVRFSRLTCDRLWMAFVLAVQQIESLYSETEVLTNESS